MYFKIVFVSLLSLWIHYSVASDVETVLSLLYSSTAGDSWSVPDGWNSGVVCDVQDGPSSWYGVSCVGGLVQSINLSGNNLTGTIPDLSVLVALKELDLSNNFLSGGFPILPSDLNLVKLGNNRLSGVIGSSSISSALTLLEINDNQFSAFPSLSYSPSLKYLHAQNNPFYTFPDTFGATPNLIELRLSSSRITGTIPSSIATSLPNLQLLYLDNNNFIGPISILSKFSSVIKCDVSHNQLSGEIPDMANLNITTLNLSHNSLTGTLDNTTTLAKMIYLDVSNNQLTGGIPVPKFTNLTKLKTLYAQNNYLSGELTTDVQSLATRLAYFNISCNNFAVLPQWCNSSYCRPCDIAPPTQSPTTRPPTNPPITADPITTTSSPVTTNPPISTTNPPITINPPTTTDPAITTVSPTTTTPPITTTTIPPTTPITTDPPTTPTTTDIPTTTTISPTTDLPTTDPPTSTTPVPSPTPTPSPDGGCKQWCGIKTFDGQCYTNSNETVCEFGSCNTLGQCVCNNASLEYPYCFEYCGDGVCTKYANGTIEHCYTDCGAGDQCDGIKCPPNSMCENGLCRCLNASFDGPTCSQVRTGLDLRNTTRNEIQIASSNSSFYFSVIFHDISECDQDGEFVRGANLTDAMFECKKSGSVSEENTFCVGSLLDIGAQIYLNTTLFRNGTVYNFADAQFTLQPETVKITMGLSNWPFHSVKNSLLINIDTVSNNTNFCGSYAHRSGDELKSYTFTTGQTTLYGSFTEKALIDGKSKSIHTTFDDKNSRIGLKLPYFWYSAIIDPNYNVLVSPQLTENSVDQATCSPSSLLHDPNPVKVQLPITAIIGSIAGVVGVVLVVGIVMFHKKRKETARQRRHLATIVSRSNLTVML